MVVIGSGLGGLTCGALTAKYGMRVSTMTTKEAILY